MSQTPTSPCLGLNIPPSSNVISNTLQPVWNEIWRVRNVPSTASLKVEVLDKDEGSASDDFIGRFDISLTPGAREVEIEGPILALRKERGKFWLSISTKPSTMRLRNEFQFLFDGPPRYTRHFSPTVGLLTTNATQTRDDRLYSTWKFTLKGLPLFFRDVTQGWNKNYAAAQKIFGNGPASLAVRSGIQAGHRMLYARLAGNGYGIINNVLDNGTEEPVPLKAVLNAGSGDNTYAERIKPAVYTYIISAVDDTWRFSETGAAFFVDFASKHALHANCAQAVRYSGEFHPRPVGGWENFNDSIADEDVDWELVVDNNSGTYAPDKMMLPTVKECLEANFGCGLAARNSKGQRGFRVVTYDQADERLKASVKACRDYALHHRGVTQDDLEPHVADGEVTLNAAAIPTPS